MRYVYHQRIVKFYMRQCQKMAGDNFILEQACLQILFNRKGFVDLSIMFGMFYTKDVPFE